MKFLRYLTIILSALTVSASAQVKLRLGAGDILNRDLFNADTRSALIDGLGIPMDAARGVDRRLIGKNPSTTRAYYSVFNHTTPTYTRNPNCWAATVNLSCVSVWNSTTGAQGAGTLVSPRHIIFAEHFNGGTGSNPWPNGTSFRFVAPDNATVTRTLTGKLRVGTSDICVGLLDSDVPSSIDFARILPDGYQSYASILFSPLLYLDQDKRVHVGDETGNLLTAWVEQSGDATRSAFYEVPVAGDSGSPIFLVVGNTPVLTAVFHTSATGDALTAYVPDINSAMATLGGGYQLTTIDGATLFPAKVAWASLTGKPAFTSTATTPSSIAPTAGQIPIVRSDTNKLDVAVIPATTAAAVEWTNVQSRPFTEASQGGNGAADDGRALLFGSSGEATAENFVCVDNPTSQPGRGAFTGSFLSVMSGAGDVPPLAATGTGGGPGSWPVFSFLGQGAGANDVIGSMGRTATQNEYVYVYGNGAFEWTTAAASIKTLTNLGGEPSDARTKQLSAMSLVKSVSSITGVSSGISGVTYNARSGTVFVIRNVSGAAGTIYELTTDGGLLRTITNSNFIDTEAIEWVGYDAANGADVFIVGEEDHTTAANEAQLTLCRLTPAATTLDRMAAGNVTVTTAYSGGNIGNLGLEAICYDPRRKMVYYTIEKQTAAGSDNTAGTGNAKIFQRSVTSTGTLAFGAESVLCNINSLFSGTLTDISDASFDIQSDTILLQSDESKKVVRLSLSGTVVEQLATSTATQPEGLAIHPDGTQLFVVGEPQEFFRYQLGVHRGDALLNQRIYPREASSLNTQTSTTYTLLPSDNGKVITLNNAAGITLTVPTGLPIGFSCRVIQLGAGLVTLTASGTTVNSFGGTLALGGQYAAGDIQGTATANTFVLIKHQ